ncbi:MAG: DNA-directed RNA polymerase subunit omega [Acidobacteriota bacterium]
MQEYPDTIDSKFRYVLLAAARAEQIMRGAEPKVDKPLKATSAGMAEITDDLIAWDYGAPEDAEVVDAETEG